MSLCTFPDICKISNVNKLVHSTTKILITIIEYTDFSEGTKNDLWNIYSKSYLSGLQRLQIGLPLPAAFLNVMIYLVFFLSGVLFLQTAQMPKDKQANHAYISMTLSTAGLRWNHGVDVRSSRKIYLNKMGCYDFVIFNKGNKDLNTKTVIRKVYVCYIFYLLL